MFTMYLAYQEIFFVHHVRMLATQFISQTVLESKYSRVHPACRVRNSFHKLYFGNQTIAFLNAGYTIHFKNYFGHQSTPGYIRHARYTIHFTNCFRNHGTAVYLYPACQMHPACKVYKSNCFWLQALEQPMSPLTTNWPLACHSLNCSVVTSIFLNQANGKGFPESAIWWSLACQEPS